MIHILLPYPLLDGMWLLDEPVAIGPSNDDEPDLWIPRNAAPSRPVAKTRRAQRGVEFIVEDAHGFERSFRTYNEAAGFAVGVAAASGRPVHLDVLVMSRDGAAERIQISAKSVSRTR